MGPAPKPQRRRRNAAPQTTKLPAGGRSGPLPDWPLPANRESRAHLDEHEQVIWRELWSTPQAVAWERLSWVRDVAQYARWKARAEFGDLEAAKEARQLSDRLGLTPLALLRLRWEITEDEVAEQRSSRTARSSARRGLKAVDGAG